MPADFPRLLVATEFPPNAPGGGPAVVRQMLRDWPVERLYWWSCRPDTDMKAGQRVKAHTVAAIPEKLYPHNRWCSQKCWILENLWSPWAAANFNKTVRQYLAEAVWVIPHAFSIPPLASGLPASRAPYHVTVQDYMDTLSSVRRFGPARAARLVASAERIFANATTRDATSHPMIADLQARTGKPSAQMLHAGLETEELAALDLPLPAPQGKIRIAYAGTILVEEEFAFFAAAMEAIRQKLPAPVSLEFFGNHSYASRPWFNAAWMREHGNLSAADLQTALKGCTWGFSPMALKDDDSRYNRFSFPTKYIVYLGARLPVICLGHPESSVMKMAAAYNTGLCAATSDRAAFSAQLLEALSDPNPAATFREGIRACAFKEFDAARMRSILYDCFRAGAAAFRGRPG